MKIPSWITKEVKNLEKYMNDPARAGVTRRLPDPAPHASNSYQYQTSNSARYLATTNSVGNWTTGFNQPTAVSATQAAFQSQISALNNRAPFCVPLPATAESTRIANQTAKNQVTSSVASKNAGAKITASASAQTPGPVTGLFSLVMGLFSGNDTIIKISSGPKYDSIVKSLGGGITTTIYIFKETADITVGNINTSNVDSIAIADVNAFFASDHPNTGYSSGILTSGIVNEVYNTFAYAYSQ
jgi:hypothetical protein